MTLTAGPAAWPITVATVASPTGAIRGLASDFHRRGIELCPSADAYAVLHRLGTESGMVVVAPTDMTEMRVADFVDIVVSLAHAPVLIGLAAALPDGFVEECLDRGARGMVPMPLTPSRLTVALQPFRLRADKATAPPLQHGLLTLNTAEHRVLVGTTEVHLSPKEFQVLEYMLLSSPALVSIGELVQEFASGDNELDMRVRIAIYRIRNKLSRAVPGLPPFIETVRGIGYRIAG